MSISLLGRLSVRVFILGLLVGGAGCDSQPDDVHSPTQPASQQDSNGTKWVSFKRSGDNDAWFFVPEQVAVATGIEQAREGFSFAVIVNGRQFAVTKHGDGFDYNGMSVIDLILWQNVCGWFLLAAVVVLVIKNVQARLTMKEMFPPEYAETLRANHQELCRRVEDEREMDQRKFAGKFKKQKQKFERKLHSLRHQLRIARLASEKDEILAVNPTSDEARRKFGQAVRDRLLGGKETNDSIAVTWAFDPEMTGAIVFRWELVRKQGYPLSVRIYRGNSIIRTASGVFTGEFAYWLATPGRRCKFTFEVHDSFTTFSDPLVIDLTLPPLASWNHRTILPPPAKKPTEEERRRLADEWEAREKRRASEAEKDPDRLKKLFAIIEQERNERFGEVG